MKIEEIKTIIKLMSENDLTEFKIESEDMTLCLRRGAHNMPQVVAPAMAPAIVAPAPVSAPVPAPAPAPAAVPAPAEVKKDAAPDADKIITAPLVGTFYRARNPEADPFVKVGAKVGPDTTVCIVETMKVMSEIKAEKSGVIKEILVENGQTVEFGQPLFILE